MGGKILPAETISTCISQILFPKALQFYSLFLLFFTVSLKQESEDRNSGHDTGWIQTYALHLNELQVDPQQHIQNVINTLQTFAKQIARLLILLKHVLFTG